MNKIVYFVFLLSLFATVTNRVPLSLSFAVLVIMLPFLVRRVFDRTLPRFYFILLGLYAYVFLSTLIYSPSELIDPLFYRWDGNFFPVFMPVVILGLFPMQLKITTLLKYFVIWASLVCLVGNFIVLNDDPSGVHFLFFLTHNAAGGFLSIVTAFCAGLFVEKRKWYYLAIGLVDLFVLYEVNSRGSLLAIATSLFQVVLLKERFTRIFVGGAVVAVLGLLAMTYPLWVSIGRPYDFSRVNEVPSFARSNNISLRVLILWPRAVDNFLKSPIVGQGFGSYNDVPYQFTNLGFAVLNTGGPHVNSDAFAHNSYLNFISETGLLGLSLIVLLLVELRGFISRADLPPAADWGFRIAFWVVIWSSFTENRLTNPSQMLPFTILLGFALADFRHRQLMEAAPAKADNSPSSTLPAA